MHEGKAQGPVAGCGGSSPQPPPEAQRVQSREEEKHRKQMRRSGECVTAEVSSLKERTAKRTGGPAGRI